ncbi:Major facilitator superfamily domain, general substrate transporter [Moelleriella libera RCEF 2490]|uniref:Major facilitator superfamily domain, general substrate transporter n=1 Tax=Moelleriella libera RCEF 2490 TaxID=1081109 RepID=A0A167YAZ2_9HYPO|nr:Major facilitator superfamily domain, general substrate transporter [Moelleriella libera RCEF 2490]
MAAKREGGPAGVPETRTRDENDNDHDHDDVYDRLPRRQKWSIVAVLSYCAFLSPLASTSILSATPEVAATYHASGSVINVSNAGYLAFMGLSPMVWGPTSQVFGRRPVLLLTGVLFFTVSLATAVAPDLASFFAFRALSALEGTAFILLGSACLGCVHERRKREWSSA